MRANDHIAMMDLQDAAADVEEAAEDLAAILERSKRYVYEEVALKRWILGDGGRAGNCENCVEAADEGWIDMDAIFDMFDEDIDEPPGHPNCTCTLEVKDTRRRVYA